MENSKPFVFVSGRSKLIFNMVKQAENDSTIEGDPEPNQDPGHPDPDPDPDPQCSSNQDYTMEDGSQCSSPTFDKADDSDQDPDYKDGSSSSSSSTSMYHILEALCTYK
ncbi:clumping factor B-like isoform X2 [Nilaparvata lugens]|uniref:clumping factor B-like isoform X2 n=1 Tax=Nilaparvata lugens TaxID=108931 RepID=UPI00193DA3EF|nr:clumping factor B-like isoform X2 [Nilaparvata lugens]